MRMGNGQGSSRVGIRRGDVAGQHTNKHNTLSGIVLTNWLESCGGCCTVRGLCSDLSHIYDSHTTYE